MVSRILVIFLYVVGLSCTYVNNATAQKDVARNHYRAPRKSYRACRQTLDDFHASLIKVVKKRQDKQVVAMLERKNSVCSGLVRYLESRFFLHECAAFELSNTMIWFAEHGGNLDLVDRDGTALHLAVINQWHKGIKLLSLLGANTNLPDKDGDYPLHIAVSFQDLDAVKILVKYEAEIAKTNSEGRSVWEILAANGADIPEHAEAAQLVKEFFSNAVCDQEVAQINGFLGKKYKDRRANVVSKHSPYLNDLRPSLSSC